MTFKEAVSSQEIFAFSDPELEGASSPVVLIEKQGDTIVIWDGSDHRLRVLKDFSWASLDGQRALLTHENQGQIFIAPVRDWPEFDQNQIINFVVEKREEMKSEEWGFWWNEMKANYRNDF